MGFIVVAVAGRGSLMKSAKQDSNNYCANRLWHSQRDRRNDFLLQLVVSLLFPATFCLCEDKFYETAHCWKQYS